MTYKEWEKKLSKYLKPLAQEERLSAVEYYREMYGDKLESGIPTEEILKDFFKKAPNSSFLWYNR